MVAMVSCETAGTFDPTIQSRFTRNGVREQSYGLAQIHITDPAWKGITKEDAQDPYYALAFIAEHWDERWNLWTCYSLQHGAA